MSNIIDKIRLSGVTYTLSGQSGGGKAIEGGRGISVATGETADTVSFNLPISAGTGTDSIQEGSNTIASGNYSHSEGSGTTASGNYSHAEGARTSATTNYSHSEGYRTLASADSHAEGHSTLASGNYSHAEGQYTSAQTLDSHAEGYKTITKNAYEHAACRFNKSVSAVALEFGDSGNTLFSIGNGNGNSEQSRHNALEARQNGDIYIANTNDTSTNNFYEKPMVKLQDYLASPTEKSTWNAKSDFSGDYNDLTNKLSAGTNITIVDNVISATGGGGGVPESAFTAYTASTDNRISTDEEVTAAGLNALNDKINNISGTATVELTQAEYDALVSAGTVSADTYYIITDAQAGDLTQYWTSAQTQSAITEATSGKASQSDLETVSGQVANKQDTLVSGTNIKTINNESLLGSGNIDIQGGSSYTAGRGIDITNDTISFSLPISATTGDNLIIGDKTNQVNGLNNSAKSIVFGRYSKVKSYDSLVGGYNCSNEKAQSQVFGNYSKTKNPFEFASGRYNNSVSASTTFGDSGNTLFSVGNGSDENARHNAFEVRQNGDIYLSSGGTDIKLQDHLGGTASSTITSGDTNAVAGGAVYDKFDEVEQVTAAALNQLNDKMVEDEEVTAAGLNALNDKFGGLKLVKLTQTQYNNLSPKDNNTLYVIV